jgi:malic enzyme
MAEEKQTGFTEREALFYHETIRPGKIEIVASKPMATQRDLSLAYSPGVAVPVQAIADDPANAARLHRQGQPRRGHLQRHRDPGHGQSRRARRPSR